MCVFVRENVYQIRWHSVGKVSAKHQCHRKCVNDGGQIEKKAEKEDGGRGEGGGGGKFKSYGNAYAIENVIDSTLHGRSNFNKLQLMTELANYYRSIQLVRCGMAFAHMPNDVNCTQCNHPNDQ